MKRVLVTGASGFIGGHTLKYLVHNGYEVYAVSSSEIIKSKSQSVIWYKCNLFNSSEIEKMMEEIKPTHIIHFAWYVVPGKYVNAEENLHWVQISMNLLKYFKIHGGKRFVFAGTCFEYDLSWGCISENETPSKPDSLYGKCKYDFENKAIEYCYKNGVSFASGRIFYVYGEREDKKRIIPYVINCLLNNQLAKCSNGEQVRDFMYVEDVANAFVKILDCDVEGIINVGSGKAAKLKDVLLKIAEKLNKEELISFGDIKAAADEPKMIVANNEKLRNETNWVQQFDLDGGLHKVIKWWKEN